MKAAIQHLVRSRRKDTQRFVASSMLDMRRYLDRLLLFACVLLVAALWLLAVPVMWAQDFQRGFVPYQSYESFAFDSVNLSSGNLLLDIPIVSFPQRGTLHPFSLSLRYNNPHWWGTYQSTCTSNSCTTWITDGRSVHIVRDNTYALIGYSDNVGTPDYPVYVGASHVVDNSGAHHVLEAISNDATGVSATIDGTELIVNTQLSSGLIDSDGMKHSTLWFQTSADPAAGGGDPTVLIMNGFGDTTVDPNGNAITPQFYAPPGGDRYYVNNWIDSLGRFIPAPRQPLPNSYGYPPLGNPFCETLNFPGINGGTAPITFCYTRIQVLSSFPAGTGINAAISPLALTSVTLPNGTQWKFDFDNFGYLSAITLPTGGKISYTWTYSYGCSRNLANLAQGWSPGSFSCERVISTRSFDANDGSGPKTWLYSLPPTAGGGPTVITVTDPGGNDTVHTFGFPNPQIVASSWYELKTRSYSGPQANNNLIKTIDTQYGISPFGGWRAYSPALSNCTDVNPNSNFTPDDTYANISGDLAGAFPTFTTTTWPNGQVSQTKLVYDSGSSYWIAAAHGSFGGYSCPLIYGKQVQKFEYDYGSGAPGPLLRQTNTQYLWQTNSNYLNADFLNLVSSTTILGPSGLQAASTTFAYDETTNGSPNCLCGNSTSVTQWLNGGTSPKIQHAYNSQGMRTKAFDANLNVTQFGYDSTGAFLSQITYPPTNGVQHVETFAFDSNTGLITSHTDQNQQTTSYGYDVMRRLTSVTYPPGGGSETYSYNDSTPNPSFTYTKQINSSTNYVQIGVVDGFGRPIRTQLQSDPGGVTYADTTYDALHRVATVSNPHRTAASSTDGTTSYIYDALGRTCVVIPPDGTTVPGNTCPSSQPANDVFTSYTGSTVTVTDQAGKSRKTVTDGLGRLTQVFEDPAGLNYETDYTYDVLDNLLTVNQKGGSTDSANWRTRTFAYDSLSRLVCASNPESSSAACPATATSSYTTGTTGYAYDANGNLSTKTALAPNQTGTATVITSYSYDALNRLIQKGYNDSGFTPNIQYGFDGVALAGCATPPPTLTDSNPKGRRTAMCDGAGAESWSHDAMGRVLTDARTTNSLTKSTIYAYSPYLDGSINTITYPSGRTLTYSTGGAERLLSVQDNSTSVYYASSVLYAPQGALSSLTNGPNLNSTHIYNSRLQPCWLYTTTGTALATNTTCTGTAATGNILDFKYNFNLGVSNNGNVMGISNNRDTTRSVTSTYDSLNRISSALTTSTHSTSPANCWGETYSADAWGNLQSIAATTNSNYTGCSQESGFDFTNFIGTNNRITYTGYGYDAPGNLNSGSGVSGISYNAENELVTAAGVAYKYDGDDKRVQKSSGTLYWYGVGTDALDETDLSGNLSNEYVYFGSRIARRDPSNNVFYYFADHVGTSRTIAEVAAGQSTATLCYDADFYPFGVERTPIVNTCSQNYKFTGKERDIESALDNFGARYDSSWLGRFMSPDPFSRAGLPLDTQDPQSWNAYAYVRNNPLNLTDPDGTNYLVCEQNEKGVENCADLTNEQYQQFLKDNPNLRVTPSGDIITINKNGTEKKTGSETYYNENDVAAAKTITQWGPVIEAAGLAELIILGPELGPALLGATPEIELTGIGLGAGGLAIGKMGDLNAPDALNPGEYTLPGKGMPNKGSPKANWEQNASMLRFEMSKGKPIRDVSAGKPGSESGFLRAERNLLRDRGWTQRGDYWYPPHK